MARHRKPRSGTPWGFIGLIVLITLAIAYTSTHCSGPGGQQPAPRALVQPSLPPGQPTLGNREAALLGVVCTVWILAWLLLIWLRRKK